MKKKDIDIEICWSEKEFSIYNNGLEQEYKECFNENGLLIKQKEGFIDGGYFIEYVFTYNNK